MFLGGGQTDCLLSFALRTDAIYIFDVLAVISGSKFTRLYEREDRNV